MLIGISPNGLRSGLPAPLPYRRRGSADERPPANVAPVSQQLPATPLTRGGFLMSSSGTGLLGSCRFGKAPGAIEGRALRRLCRWFRPVGRGGRELVYYPSKQQALVSRLQVLSIAKPDIHELWFPILSAEGRTLYERKPKHRSLAERARRESPKTLTP